MTLHDLYAKWECYEDIKTCVSLVEYTENASLIQDVSTMLSTDGYDLSEQQIENNINIILPEFVGGYYNFPQDTSLLYAFSKKNINKMLVANPVLALYVDENDIIVKNYDTESDGVYLSFILPEHEQVFKQYSPWFLEKENAVKIPWNPTDWEYEDRNERCMIITNDLAELYATPSIGIDIHNKSITIEWNKYSFLYLDNDFPSDLKDNLISAGGEIEARPV